MSRADSINACPFFLCMKNTTKYRPASVRPSAEYTFSPQAMALFNKTKERPVIEYLPDL